MSGRREIPDDPVEANKNAGQPAPDFRYTLLKTPTVDRRLDTQLLERAIKRHVAAHVGDGAAKPCQRTDSLDGSVEGLEPDAVLEALLVSDQAFLDSVVPTLLKNAVNLSTFYRAIVRPVSVKLGELWCEDEVNFVKVEIVSMRLRLMCNQLVARRMADRLTWREDDRRRILLANTGGDQHTLGFSLAEAFFEDAGWHVGGGFDLEPGPDYYEMLRSGDFSFVALAIARDDACDPTEIVSRTREASGDRGVRICLGGVAVGANPARYQAADADIVALDAPDAVFQAEQMLAQSRWTGLDDDGQDTTAFADRP
jgi:methylmalonyl-CoA mutase cobalamin-binding subunit